MVYRMVAGVEGPVSGSGIVAPAALRFGVVAIDDADDAVVLTAA